MPYTYSSFSELKKDKEEGVHYQIHLLDRSSAVVVMAPHGGKIEPYTTELAEFVAGQNLSFYSFLGCQLNSNFRELHVVSHCYDEPGAVALVSAAQTVLTIHGEGASDEEFLMVGGLHEELRDSVLMVATDCGIECRAPSSGLHGTHPNNICNRGRLGAGVQIAASRGLRDLLKAEGQLRTQFVSRIREVVVDFD
jgi:phage replication-related protein YjqB (UPF0714/DUF867 family)